MLDSNIASIIDHRIDLDPHIVWFWFVNVVDIRIPQLPLNLRSSLDRIE